MIIFDQVTKIFGDGTVGLEDVTFSIEPGEMVLITGSSGAGKTTLMRLLTKEYEPTEGDIFFNDESLAHIKPSQLHHHRRQIGVIFQDYKLLPEMNVWENIALALDILGMKESEIEERITDLLELVDLTSKAYLFPVQLSGGEAQRVSIARALAPAPKVIFADEPTGNLDPQTSKTIAQLFHKINELGTTILLSTHDQQVLDMLERRTLTLEKGRIIQDSEEKAQKTAKKKTAKDEKPDKSDDADTDEADNDEEVKHIAKPTSKIKIESGPTNRVSKWLGQLWPFGAEPDTLEEEEDDDDDDDEVDEKKEKAAEPEEHNHSKKEELKERKTDKSEKKKKKDEEKDDDHDDDDDDDDEEVVVKVERL